MDLKVVPLTYLEQMKLAATMGSTNMSETWWRTSLTAAAIREIDGRKVMKPSHPKHIRAILKQVGDEWPKAIALAGKASAPEDAEITVTVSRPTTLEFWDIAEYAGQLYDIQPWRNLANLAIAVRSINGAEVEFPQNVPDLYQRFEVLGVSGINMAAELLTTPKDEQPADKVDAPGN